MFLLVWGFKVRAKAVDAVRFFCPRCGGDRDGHTMAARRWFTLFWIPLIPLKHVGEYVECDHCHDRFGPGVLDQATTESLHQSLRNATYALTLMVVRTAAAVTPPLRERAVRDLQDVAPGYDDDRLDREVAGIDPALAEQYVAPLAGPLEVTGKERLVGDLVRLARAGDGLTADQQALVAAVGRGLGLTPAHVSGIVSTVSAPTPTGDGPTP